MIRSIKRLLCRWHGHSDVQNDTQNWVCLSCGTEMDYDEAVKTPWQRQLKDWIKSWKDWWHCPECGRRCGKHDDVPHIPF